MNIRSVFGIVNPQFAAAGSSGRYPMQHSIALCPQPLPAPPDTAPSRLLPANARAACRAFFKKNLTFAKNAYMIKQHKMLNI